MGFADFHFGWGKTPSPPEHPVSRVAYVRWDWASLEPSPGVYNFTILDDAITQARARNQTLAFRITPGIPTWLKNSGVPQLGSGSSALPDHNNPTFLAQHEKLVAAFGSRYAGSTDIDHVDIGSVGCWGEWNSACCPAGQSASCKAYMPTQANRDKIVDWYFRYFPSTPLVALAEGVGYANTRGAGWRGDCFGDYGYFSTAWNHMDNMYSVLLQKPEVANAWQKGPVQMEICGYMYEWPYRNFDIDKILQKGLDWHISVLNAKSSAVPEQWRAKVQEWLKKIGYRFVLTQLTHGNDLSPGGQLTLQAAWVNKGVAPAYHHWPVAYRLRDSAGATVAQWKSSADVRTWLPGSRTVFDTVQIPTAIAGGSYSLDVAILTEDQDRAFVQLAIAGKRPDLWYPVSTVRITGAPAAQMPTGSSSVWLEPITPVRPWTTDRPVTLGVKFRSETAGLITGIRFWKGSSADNGTHVGLLYSRTGEVLAKATFTSETASGWQQVQFAVPVSIAANTTYVAAYFTSTGYVADPNYFVNSGVDASPLHFLKYGVDGGNGVYTYASTPQFPASSAGSNYWVDVMFALSPTATPASTGISSISLWSALPTVSPTESSSSTSPVTLGVKFRSDVPGQVKGIRFWKNSAGDKGTHIGLLYSPTGVVLAQATFTGESSYGWQQVNFSSPVTISANTTYTAAYFSTSGFSATGNYFISQTADMAPLHAIPYASGGNGMYSYGTAPMFPVSTRGANYWVDVVFSTSSATPVLTSKTISVWPTDAPAEVRIGSPVWRAWRADSPVTLGVKFTSDVAGTVTGVRFWKASSRDNGKHIGMLYSAAGTLLAQATFTSESGSGWQQVTFSTPVPISANTSYVAAYFTTSGWSADESYFKFRGQDGGPLHAPRSVTGAQNGFYMYSASPQFPRGSVDANYWVDVMFKPQ